MTIAIRCPNCDKSYNLKDELIDGLEEVQEAYSLTGEADYLVKIAVPDLKALSHILNDVFLPHESVAHLTRAGKSRTPAKIVNLPSWFGSFSSSSSPVAIR